MLTNSAGKSTVLRMWKSLMYVYRGSQRQNPGKDIRKSDRRYTGKTPDAWRNSFAQETLTESQQRCD